MSRPLTFNLYVKIVCHVANKSATSWQLFRLRGNRCNGFQSLPWMLSSATTLTVPALLDAVQTYPPCSRAVTSRNCSTAPSSTSVFDVITSLFALHSHVTPSQGQLQGQAVNGQGKKDSVTKPAVSDIMTLDSESLCEFTRFMR